MFYKNTSNITKTFYGVSFEPGQTKQVNRFINDAKMVRVNKLPEEPPVRSELKSGASGNPDKSVKSKSPQAKSEPKPKVTETKSKVNKEEITNGTDSDK